MLRPKSVRTRFQRTLQNSRGFTILPLIDQHISDRVLNFRPLTSVAFSVTQFGCLAKMRRGLGILDLLLGRESSQFQRTNYVGIVGGRRIPGLDCSLYRQTLRLLIIVGDVSSARSLERARVGRVS